MAAGYQDGLGQDVISVKVPGNRIDYVPRLTLRDAVFHVSEAGRQRCLAEGVRNVHAWVVGTQVPDAYPAIMHGDRAIYDPRKGGTFVNARTLEPVLTASKVYMAGKFVWYKP